ncbi:PREDICTED: odorant receptor 4-like [Dinoponera quadriceps]|uniref:Odorant receptor 4-like n=1 Tax=Dinoponera quadriceps TaxID=609295 RepID=A0A6P3XPA2_DINQU|nr:PREDICTED: odorant receptor 4-like [Dinoponera quadriceps]
MIQYQSDSLPDFMDGMSSAMTYTLMFVKLAILWANQRCGVLAVNTGEVQRMNVSAREQILKMKLPFKVNTSPVYLLITILQFLHLVLCGCGISMVNSLIVTLILHIGGQIDVMRDWLSTAFSKNVIGTVNGITMRALVTKHQRIIMFSQNIENLYTYIALILFVSDTIIICCLGFIIVTSIGTPDGPAILLRSVLYYMVMNLEAFIFCLAGEYLNAKSQMIGDAAYDSLWYDFTSSKSRIVLLLILRSQKRLTITIGKIMDLSLERFTSVVKASASYISVLLAMY